MSANWSRARRSGGRSRWTATRPFVARPQFALRDVERGRQLLREIVGQGDLAALNTSHELRGHSGSGTEHRLRHASNNTPVAGKSLALWDIDEISNSDAEDVGDTRKQIDLGDAAPFSHRRTVSALMSARRATSACEIPAASRACSSLSGRNPRITRLLTDRALVLTRSSSSVDTVPPSHYSVHVQDRIEVLV